jgi:hypothetical protein
MKKLIIATSAIILLFSSDARAQQGGEAPSELVYNGYGRHPGPRWRPQPPPRSPEQAEDPRVAEAIRTAPPLPDPPAPYPGPNQAMKAARSISKRTSKFFNFRATIALAVWKVNPASVWRIRPSHKCQADLREQGIRFRPHKSDEPEPPADAEDDEIPAPHPTPTPGYLKGPVKGVNFTTSRGNAVLISCELAARLPAFVEVLERHGVDRVEIMSAYRQQPRTSFHTFGMALDISRFHLREPLRGPRGEQDQSQWASVLDDFLETPDIVTCDPSMLGPDSPLGDNERGRRLLSIACELRETGVFSTVITPNYNPGHRDHFHIDVRPDDPRIFIR